MTHTVSESTILPISEITLRLDVNIRELDTDYVGELMEAQSEYGESHWQTHWKEKPKINQDGILFSGFHTITAAKRNFGNAHEVDFQVVEGDPYLLAACENAVHGKRRTNADKRAAVLRWLQDDEGQQWTDSHIAKQCHVSDFLVNSVDVSLQENGSDTYDRPTKRKYIDKHGNVAWMETAKINDTPGASQVSVVSGEQSETSAVTKAERLAAERQLAQDAEIKMWDALKAVAPDWNYDDFSAAACDWHLQWGVDTFPNLMESDIPAIWKARFDFLRAEIELPAAWIQHRLTRMENRRAMGAGEKSETSFANGESHIAPRETARMPEREVSIVSIGISNNTYDAFERVEFTDEASDEISCELSELPEYLREALLEIAIKKIQAARKGTV